MDKKWTTFSFEHVSQAAGARDFIESRGFNVGHIGEVVGAHPDCQWYGFLTDAPQAYYGAALKAGRQHLQRLDAE